MRDSDMQSTFCNYIPILLLCGLLAACSSSKVSTPPASSSSSSSGSSGASAGLPGASGSAGSSGGARSSSRGSAGAGLPGTVSSRGSPAGAGLPGRSTPGGRPGAPGGVTGAGRRGASPAATAALGRAGAGLQQAGRAVGAGGRELQQAAGATSGGADDPLMRDDGIGSGVHADDTGEATEALARAEAALAQAGAAVANAGARGGQANAEAALAGARVSVILAEDAVGQALENGQLSAAQTELLHDALEDLELAGAAIDRSGQALVLAQEGPAGGSSSGRRRTGGAGTATSSGTMSSVDRELHDSLSVFDAELGQARRDARIGRMPGVQPTTSAPAPPPGLSNGSSDNPITAPPAGEIDSHTNVAVVDAPAPDFQGDLPVCQNDDIVARQLREAVGAEQDPELRRKLQDEYIRYKQGLGQWKDCQ